MRTSLKKHSLRFIVLMGIVSLFADCTYEGARSIIGPYLSSLGASGTAVGFIVGLGTLAGYSVRVFSGYESDKWHAYWLLTFLGYFINVVAVPLLAFANSWEVAAIFIVLERFGKGLRTPARDTMLSFATKQVGRGFGFGLNEALDQIGALTGPLVVAAILFYQKEYAIAFACLAVPAFITICLLTLARFLFPRADQMEKPLKKFATKGFSTEFWIYVIGAACLGAGFIDYALISYHFEKNALVTAMWIPVIYAAAMAVDGVAALGMGKMFDLIGIRTLAIVTAVTSIFAPLILLGNFWMILLGMLLWGINLGAQESIMRSYIAVVVPVQKRGSAYGIFYLGFGFAWLIGSSMIGWLYDHSLLAASLFSFLVQIVGAGLFFLLRKKSL